MTELGSQYLAESEITAQLDADEKLLWSGRPGRGLALRSSDIIMIPFSLFWAGFAFFWEYEVVSSAKDSFMMIWGIPFVLVGIYILFGRFIVDKMNRDKTSYGVTSKRVIIISGLFGRKVKSLNTKSLSEISLEKKGDGSGTITFSPLASGFGWAQSSGWPGADKYAAPSFDMIPNAKEVYDLIIKTQNSPQSQF
jgi:hypothetical protein